MLQRLLLRLLRGYKRWVSPHLAPSCRFVPTCSEYAMEAVERKGALRGGAQAAWRLLRCHPFSRGGFDPVVPEPGPRLVPPPAQEQNPAPRERLRVVYRREGESRRSGGDARKREL